LRTASTLLEQLEQAGYALHIEGKDLLLKWRGDGNPSPENVELLKKVKNHKAKVIDYLQLLQTPQAKVEKPILIESSYLNDTFYLAANEAQA
jgi:hypothetical protein